MIDDNYEDDGGMEDQYANEIIRYKYLPALKEDKALEILGRNLQEDEQTNTQLVEQSQVVVSDVTPVKIVNNRPVDEGAMNCREDD